ncbi:hypothetical protein [Allorhodopirellula solitaria]|nr:hypothetical protein [Allorhodopirellula solitaria]
MKRQFFHCGCLFVIAIAAGQAGCSKQETASTPAPTATVAVEQSPEQASEAEAVVSHFLDRIRRGGENHNAMSLLTDRAQSELQRIGQVVQPIGSPDAQFEVTRSTPMPIDTNDAGEPVTGRLVHCIWTEPAAAEETDETASGPQTYQVVWSVMKQSDGWKISGLVLEMSPEEPPMVLDFENGEQMAKILGGEPAEQTAATPEEETPAPVR